MASAAINIGNTTEETVIVNENKPAAQAADADPPPMKLHQQAKSTP